MRLGTTADEKYNDLAYKMVKQARQEGPKCVTCEETAAFGLHDKCNRSMKNGHLMVWLPENEPLIPKLDKIIVELNLAFLSTGHYIARDYLKAARKALADEQSMREDA